VAERVRQVCATFEIRIVSGVVSKDHGRPRECQDFCVQGG
jgi:hypothetical protein